ncbi:DUF4139 domain-containing protein [Streptacidiphilus albus]|uniref:DUF4139 domain-containing protein n=3 Tax=Streptacidiphilus albus TaxID=105425 RepID=UPI000690FC5D|nr:DUF4139 domain-containing protein [Streptacidiphilus albus]
MAGDAHTKARGSEPRLDSVLDSVTVHASGAVCRRSARVELPEAAGVVGAAEGPFRVTFTGLPLVLDEHSLRGRVLVGPPSMRVLGVRRSVRAELPEQADLSPLRHACDLAEAELEAARAEQAAWSTQIEHISALRAVPTPTRRGDPPRSAPTEALLELADFVDARLAELQQQLFVATDALDEAERRAESARRRLDEASTAQPTGPVRTSTSATLTLAWEPAERETVSPEPGIGEAVLELEYSVPGATWTPAYHLRLTGIEGDAPGGSLAMRASVAQRTGEDWTGVRLGLSTADLRRRTELPVLSSLRIGRRQSRPAPPLWRVPPEGLPTLFAGYDAFGRPAGGAGPEAGRAPMPAVRRARMLARPGGGPAGGPAGGGADAYGAPAQPVPGPPGAAPTGRPQPAPPPAAPVAPSASGPSRSAGARAPIPVTYTSAVASALPSGPPAPGAAFAVEGLHSDTLPGSGAALPGEGLRDLDRLVLAGPDEPASARGRLRPENGDGAPAGPVPLGAVAESRSRAEAVARLDLPPNSVPVRHSAGSFDYRYDAAAPVDVPSDGAWHSVPVREFPVELEVEHVCVPAVDARVYAAVQLRNSSANALLEGAAEVTVDGEFLLGTALPTLAPGQRRRVGLGIVESIRVARRTSMRESTAGLRSGTTVLDHGIEIELANRLGRAVTVEVRERVPVGNEKDIRIEEKPASPPWTAVPPEEDEEHQRGLRLWRVTLPARSGMVLTGGYEIRIPATKAVFDGNRRT